MSRAGNWMHRISASMDLEGESLPGLPIVEIVGQQRVLVENHCGVIEYSDTYVMIRVPFGKISIYGDKLKLSKMTKGQLFICGCIDGVKIIRG